MPQCTSASSIYRNFNPNTSLQVSQKPMLFYEGTYYTGTSLHPNARQTSHFRHRATFLSSDTALPLQVHHYHYLVEEEGVEEDTAGQGNAFTTSWSAPSSLFFFVLVVLPNKTSWGHFSVPYGRTMLMIDRTTSLTTSSPSSFPSNTCQCLL